MRTITVVNLPLGVVCTYDEKVYDIHTMLDAAGEETLNETPQ